MCWTYFQLKLQKGSLSYSLVKIHHNFCKTATDLAWKQDVHLYIAGAYAAVEIGPNALNLAGCRSVSKRISQSILKYFELIDHIEPTIVSEPLYDEDVNVYQVLKDDMSF